MQGYIAQLVHKNANNLVFQWPWVQIPKTIFIISQIVLRQVAGKEELDFENEVGLKVEGHIHNHTCTCTLKGVTRF